MARLGEILLRERLITKEQLGEALEAEKRGEGSLSAVLTAKGSIGEPELAQAVARLFRVASADLDTRPPETELARLIPEEVARKYQLVPVARNGATLVVATTDPSNLLALDDLKFLTGLGIEFQVAQASQLARTMARLYHPDVSAAPQESQFDEVMSGFSQDEISFETEESANATVLDASGAQDAPVVRLVNLILVDAIKRRASDIHIEPYEKSMRVRYRIDGGLYEVMRPPLKLKTAIVSRIKIMSALDIAERRLPQDGRIKLKLGGEKEMDFRVSVLPTLFGEKVVLRLLDKGNLQLDMTKLGFEASALAAFKGGIHRPYGIVLVTGPTGSGKTTTLYSALSELNQTSENICTAEDPVEFNLGGINQVQMHDDIGLNFAAALRSFLRQDPDVIMVGEIRDFETCEIAIKAALTGHLVLSTLHTNDAPSTVSRMLNMGVEPFLITAALNVIVAQRLVRKICTGCKEPMPAPADDLLASLQVRPSDVASATWMRGKGCEACGNTGMKGRIAIYEVLTATDAIKEAIIRGVPPAELKATAVAGGFKTLRQAAISKLIAGETTCDEVSRVTAAD